MEEEDDVNVDSYSHKKLSSAVGISCCFNGGGHQRRASLDAVSSCTYSSSPISRRSSWFKSCNKTTTATTITNHDSPARCRGNFMSRMARHRRHSSADFSYDPLSYALNFDEDTSSSSDDFRDFTARLPLSPPPHSRRNKTAKAITPPPSFDPHLPRSPIPAVAGNDDLRRGFEALSVSMNKSNRRISNTASSNSDEMDKTVASPIGISSSNQGILLELY